MIRLFWQGLTLVGTVSLAGYLAFTAWFHFGPSKPQLSHLRQQVADRLLPQILEDLRKSKDTVQSVALIHLGNDPTDYITDQLRLLIQQSGILDLRDQSLAEKLQKAINLRISSVDTLEAALTHVRDQGVDGVIFGRINTFESYPDGAKLDLEITLASITEKTVIINRRYHEEMKVGLLNDVMVRDGLTKISGFQRILGWILAVLLLPVFTIGFIRSMIQRESNRANAATLSIYTAVDALLACLLLGASLASWPSALLFLLLVGVALSYNVFIMTLALKMQ